MAGPEVALVLVDMAGRRCAIRCDDVVEIVPRMKLSLLPNAPDEVLGVLDLRGEVVPVMDVRARVAPDLATPRGHQHIVIVRSGPRLVGLAADEVVDVLRISKASVRHPGALAGGGGPGVVRVGDEMILVIEPDKVLGDEPA